jgi:hypothetical protein
MSDYLYTMQHTTKNWHTVAFGMSWWHFTDAHIYKWEIADISSAGTLKVQLNMRLLYVEFFFFFMYQMNRIQFPVKTADSINSLYILGYIML